MVVYKFIFYVPESHLDQVKNAVFAAGAGKYGNYAKCSWETLGSGQFEPLAGSEPFIGDKGKLTKVDEYRVETICKEEYIEQVIEALEKSHPYECPVYDAWALKYYSSI